METRVGLDVGERGTDRTAVGRHHRLGHLFSTEGEEHAGRFGSAKGQVVASDTGPIGAQTMRRCRVAALEGRLERFSGHHSLTPEAGGGGSHPTARITFGPLPAEGDFTGHVVEVIGDPSIRNAVDAEHG